MRDEDPKPAPETGWLTMTTIRDPAGPGVMAAAAWLSLALVVALVVLLT